MAAFTVNGRPVSAEKERKLIGSLRDSLQLTSVKGGCSEGACGACTVLIDGEPTRACIPRTDRLEGKAVLTERFPAPWTEHAFLGPECALAYPDGDGVVVLSADQGVYDTQRETMGMLGFPAEKVKVQNCLVGGGFGGKEDVTVQHPAALAAYLTKRPVKCRLSRAESLLIPPSAIPWIWSSPLAATRTAGS